MALGTIHVLVHEDNNHICMYIICVYNVYKANVNDYLQSPIIVVITCQLACQSVSTSAHLLLYRY